MSYIPRSSSIASSGAPGAIPKIVRKKHTFRVFAFFATFLIILATVSAVGTHFYKGYVEGQLAKVQAELSQQETADEALKIQELEEFHRQLVIAETLIGNHLAPSKIFEALERNTKTPVQLTDFSYSYDPGFQVLLELKGGTNELASVFAQNMEYVADVLFSDFLLGDIEVAASSGDTSDGSTTVYPVSFSVKGSVNKSILAYTGVTNAPSAPTQPILPVSESSPEMDEMENSLDDAEVLTEDEVIIDDSSSESETIIP